MPRPMRSLSILLVLAGLAALSAPARAAALDARELGRRLDAWAAPAVRSGALSGNLLVAQRDRVLLERSWGWADAARRRPNTPATRFCIASINKPLTVILTLKLIEQGKLGYRDPLSRYIPDFPHGDSITIEHLLRHRSGIPHRVTQRQDEIVPHTAADMVEFAKRAPLAFAPGSRSLYSSAGFAVLARVLEIASGRSYGQLLDETLLQPLGMRDSYHPYAHADTSNRAVNYSPAVPHAVQAPYEDYSYLVGAGALWSTCRDLHKLLWADASGALGFTARQSALRGARISWNGSTNGFRAFAEYDTTTEYSVIFTGNLHSGAVDELSAAVQALLAGREPRPFPHVPDRAVPVAPAVLARYEGRYDVAGNAGLPVRATATGLDVDGWALVAQSDTSFFSLRDFGTVVATRDSTGAFAGLRWSVGGQDFACPRVGPLAPR